MRSTAVRVRLLALKSTPAARESVSELPLPALMLILADDPSPFVVILIVSSDPFDAITNPVSYTHLTLPTNSGV